MTTLPPSPGPSGPVLARTPTEATLRWVRTSVGRGSIIAALRPMGVASTMMHAIDVLGPTGVRHELVLRRYHQRDRLNHDAWYDPANEVTVLRLLAGTEVPAPRVLAADLDAHSCETPALLTTRIPGTPPSPGHDLEPYLTALANGLVAIHAIGPQQGQQVTRIGTPPGAPPGQASAAAATVRSLPGYRPYYSERLDGARRPPPWTQDTRMWERVFATLEQGPPSGPWGFIHRDYHPGQTLWDGNRLVGIVDWTTGCCGPRGIDLARMRLNLARRYGVGAADGFLAAYRRALGSTGSSSGGGSGSTGGSTSGGWAVWHPYWDLVDAADVLLDLAEPATEGARAEYARFETWVARCLAAL